MAPMRPDGIEEEEFDLDLDQKPEQEEKPAPARAGRRTSGLCARRSTPRRQPQQPDNPPEDEYYDDEPQDEDEDEYYEEEGLSIAGLPPKTVKMIAGGVIALAVIGVIAALFLRSFSKKHEEEAQLQEILQNLLNGSQGE